MAEVFRHVSDQLARAVEENPLSGQGFSPDTVMGKWVRIAAALAISGRSLESRGDFNPVLAMAQTLTAGYGLAGRRPGCGRRRSWRPRSAGGSSRPT